MPSLHACKVYSMSMLFYEIMTGGAVPYIQWKNAQVRIEVRPELHPSQPGAMTPALSPRWLKASACLVLKNALLPSTQSWLRPGSTSQRNDRLCSRVRRYPNNSRSIAFGSVGVLSMRLTLELMALLQKMVMVKMQLAEQRHEPKR